MNCVGSKERENDDEVIDLLSKRRVATQWQERRDPQPGSARTMPTVEQKQRVENLRARAISTGSLGHWRENIRAPLSSPSSFEGSEDVDKWVGLLGLLPKKPNWTTLGRLRPIMLLAIGQKHFARVLLRLRSPWAAPDKCWTSGVRPGYQPSDMTRALTSIVEHCRE